MFGDRDPYDYGYHIEVKPVKKDGTGDTYLVTRVYTEALSTIAVLRKSGSEGEALSRVRVERSAAGLTIIVYSPAQQDDERF